MYINRGYWLNTSSLHFISSCALTRPLRLLNSLALCLKGISKRFALTSYLGHFDPLGIDRPAARLLIRFTRLGKLTGFCELVDQPRSLTLVDKLGTLLIHLPYTSIILPPNFVRHGHYCQK